MKAFWIVLLVSWLAFPLDAAGADGPGADCTMNGLRLWGRIQFVEHFPDIEVEVVRHFADLDVQLVENFPDSCGKWQVVEHFPDLKVKVVEHFGDIKIRFVEHFPGLAR